MTTPENISRLPVVLSLNKLDGGEAQFTAWLRAEPTDGGAAGFGIEGGVQILRTVSREFWEEMGSPVVIPVTLHDVSAIVAAR